VNADDRRDEARSRDWSVLDVVAMSSITLIAGILRVARLGDPSSLVFDETYYAKDSCLYAGNAKSVCTIDAEQTLVHPPLGKVLLSWGIDAFGYDSFGWRIAAAVVGTLTVALLYLLARKALGSSLGAAVASGLLTIDLLHIVQSRLAMLDSFVPFFGVAALLFAIYDRDRDRTSQVRRTLRPWRLAAGIAAGLATASKWSGAFFVIAALALTIAWELSASRADAEDKRLVRFLRAEGPSIFVYLVIVPMITYAATFVGRLDGSWLSMPFAEGSWIDALVDRHLYMFDYHHNLQASHPYESPPWSWPLLKRPVSYFFKMAENGDYMEILGTGSPFVWWTSLLALVFVAVRWIRSRSFKGPEGLILAGFGFAYLPWFLVAGDREAVFIFYLLPAIPFMCLAIGYLAAKVQPFWEGKAAIALYCAIALALFAFYKPLLYKEPIPRSQWLQRIWIFDNCDRGSVETNDETGSATGSTARGESNPPPSGWCWI
jgi:dolichyl-phosphate-mannose-protein mannosyltransferase